MTNQIKTIVETFRNYVIFKTPAGVLCRGLKHEAISNCSRSHQARAASFLNVLNNLTLNTLIREESLKIDVF